MDYGHSKKEMYVNLYGEVFCKETCFYYFFDILKSLQCFRSNCPLRGIFLGVLSDIIHNYTLNIFNHILTYVHQRHCILVSSCKITLPQSHCNTAPQLLHNPKIVARSCKLIMNP